MTKNIKASGSIPPCTVVVAATVAIDFNCPCSEALFSSLDFILMKGYSYWLLLTTAGLGMEHSQ